MNDYCKTCKHDEDIGFCDKCFYNHVLEERGIPPTEYEEKPKPLTNYDSLRAKSVEEMADWLDKLIEHCNDGPCFNCFMQKACLTSMLDWLKQEAVE